MGFGGFDEDGGVRLLHANELDGHGLKARLVQNISVDARLQGVLLEQLVRRLIRRATRLVIDDQCVRRIGRVGCQDIDGALGIGAVAGDILVLAAQREERHLGTDARPREQLGTNRRLEPAIQSDIEALALFRRQAPQASQGVGTLSGQRIGMKVLKEGVRVWDRDITRFLSSDYVPLYNPIEEYLYNTGRWDGKDRIRALADLVPCHNPHWRELFYRWFLGMVAHWRGIDKQHGNNTSPLLVGPQGYRKSTFCRILLPPELRFGYTDSIDFKSKQEAERSLGRFFLINIDEFDQINANQQGFLKHLLQKPVANLRKPYGSTIQEMRRYASFIGTSNLKDLLTDPSGSRRFICIEVTGPIQTNVTINYRQLYAQAMHDIMKGERYWLDDTDEAIVKEYNREFERVDPLEELFLCHFRGAEESEEGEWLTAMQIFNDLQQKTRDKLAINRIAAFGRTLRKLDILNKKSNRGTLYHLVRIEE